MDAYNLIMFIIVNVVCMFIVSHVAVDKEFPQSQKVGTCVVMGLAALAYLIFKVIL